MRAGAEETREDLARFRRHSALWRSKAVLRRVYRDLDRRLLDGARSPVLEIGAGTGHMGASQPGIISVDVLCTPAVDVVGDAHHLPFVDGAFSTIVMLDTFHHLERPTRFLPEAARLLSPDGRLLMIEPGITPVSRLFYAAFHEEVVDLEADPWVEVVPDPQRRAFDSNQAVPTLMFQSGDGAARLQEVEPRLRLHRWWWLSLWAYPLSGGFRPWRLLPAALVGPLLRIEEAVMPLLGRFLAFRLMVVLERVAGDR